MCVLFVACFVYEAVYKLFIRFIQHFH